MDALLLTQDGRVYGAASGEPFGSLEAAQAVIAETPQATGMTAVAVQPHTLTAAADEHDRGNRTGIPGGHHAELAAGIAEPECWGSPDGTLVDPDRHELYAVLHDGAGTVYGAADEGLFGRLAVAQEVAEKNETSLTAVQVRPFDELL